MVEFLPGDAPYDERYWQVLVEEGEHSQRSAPPADAEEIWRILRLVAEEPAPASASSDGRWRAALQAMEEGKLLELPVVGYNRGGLLVEWEGHQGFVPVSHLVDFPPYLDERERERELQARIGRVLRLRIIEVDAERSRLVLSERASRSDEARRRALLETLQPGEVRRGRVTNLCSFGAFVDLGGLEGLIHISEISWSRVDHPSDALHPGQEVEVYVLNVDRQRGRVGLSLKRVRPNPWDTVEERYYVGQIVEGVVTNVVDFGAFVEVEEGLEGLVHASELTEEGNVHPQSVLQEGQTVRLRVISVDGARRRLGLSLRRVREADEELMEEPNG